MEVLNGRSESAQRWLRVASRCAPQDIETKLQMAEAHLLAEDEGDDAINCLRSALALVPSSKPKRRKTVELRLGLTLFKLGHRQEGGSTLTRILQADMEDQEAHQAYGEAALGLGQTEDALKIYLRLVVAKSEDKTIRRLLARTLRQPDGVRLLGTHLPASKSSASALAFLASVVKDHSGVTEAINLYTQCTEHAPSASYALNLMHLHELNLHYDYAVDTLVTHCDANPTASVATLQLAEIAGALPSKDALRDAMEPSHHRRAADART